MISPKIFVALTLNKKAPAIFKGRCSYLPFDFDSHNQEKRVRESLTDIFVCR